MSEVPRMFKKVYIEISNICNLQCSFCPVVERDKKIMSPQLFEKILLQALPLSEQICLHLMGEPLAHPQFAEIMEICERHKAKINLTSNAIFLSRHRDLLLNSECLSQINFSLHSFKDNFPDKSMEQYLDEVFTFSRILASTRPSAYVNYRLWNQENETLLNATNLEVLAHVQKFFDHSMNMNLALDWKKSKKIEGKIYLHFDTEFEWPSLQNIFRSRVGYCHALSTHLGIHADGTVVPCCLDKEARIDLGNCQQSTLEDIIKSPRVAGMQKGFKNFELVEDLCQRCSFINRFDKKIPKSKWTLPMKDVR